MRYRVFAQLVKQFVGLAPVAEHRFHPVRQWRFDFAFPPEKIAIEIEGGVYTNGRHTRIQGYKNDMEKYNAATLLGWKILRFTPDQLEKASTFETIKELLITTIEAK